MRSLALVLVALSLAACAKVKASGSASAQLVTSPLPGYTCFAIMNGAGDAVGGACVKD